MFIVNSADLGAQVVEVDGDEGRHAVTVRRLRAGQEVMVGDGAGRVVVGEVTQVRGKDRLLVRVRELRQEMAPSPRITVVQALIKGERMDRAIESLTEVGADRIVPWSAANCVVRLDAGSSAAVTKMRRRSREASKQARRAFVCEVDEVATTAVVVQLVHDASLAVVLHESATESLGSHGVLGGRVANAGSEIVVIVGPEGGLTDAELDGFTAAGAASLRMGPSVMRANTAGTAALGAIMASCGRWS